MMEEVVLGFTTRPGLFYRRALQSAARESRIPIRICDLSQVDSVRWERIDALVLPGGPDIDPCYYLSSVEKSLKDHTKRHISLSHNSKKTRKRDAFEHALLMEVFHNRALQSLPLLGIGRGMQMIAVAQGIPLYLDLKRETGMIHSRFEYAEIEVLPGTMFERIVGERKFRAFKNEHQGIRFPYFLDHRDRWPHLRVSAFSHRRELVEVMEFLERPALGVQFHAELSSHGLSGKIFGWLLSEGARRAGEKRRILKEEYAI